MARQGGPAVGRRVSRRHGLFARVITSGWRALYAWHWADEEAEEEEREAARRRDDVTYDGADAEEDDDPRSLALHQLAEAALDGDRVAWCAWAELCRALKGVPVVLVLEDAQHRLEGPPGRDARL